MDFGAWRLVKNESMKHLCTYVLLLVFAAGCTSVSVQSDYSRSTNFTKYKTYAWLPASDSAMSSQKYDVNALQASFVKAVNEEMSDRGYQLDTAKPDVLLAMHAMFETKTGLVRDPIYATYSYYHPGFYNGPFYPYYWPGYTTVTEVVGYDIRTVQYKEGSVVLDIIDRANNHIVWRGWTANALKSTIESDMKKIVDNLFDRKFPVHEMKGVD